MTLVQYQKRKPKPDSTSLIDRGKKTESAETAPIIIEDIETACISRPYLI
jgi:hypothetical protein